MRSVTRVAVVVAVGLVLLWGPWRPGAPDRQVAPGDPVPHATATAGVHGEVVAVSDVSGMQESPLAAGWVLAVPGDRAGDFWATGDQGVPQPHELPYYNASMTLGAAESAGAVAAPVEGGAFALDDASDDLTGDNILCLAQGDHPLHLQGCAPVSLDGDERLRITVGEGGVQVEPAG